jgi:dipeptidyl aminopeptidase/acylaminoacyl peptidase
MSRFMRLALATLLLAFAGAPGVSAQVADAGSPSVDELVMFNSMVGGDAPQWTADGSSLVFIDGNDAGLWTVSADGGAPMRIKDGTPRNVTTRASAQTKMSPDGRIVAYTKGVEGGNDIFAFDLASKTERRVSNLSGRVRSFSFSPDGGRIALANDRHGSEDIWVLNVADGSAKRITSDARYEVFPSWTPDGSKVLYTRLDDFWVDHDVFEISPEGGPARLVLSDKDYFDYRQGGSFSFTRVSPDGKNIMFRSQRSGFATYWVAPLAGGTPREISPEQADQSDARWSPDGKQIAFLSITNGTQSLKVVPAAGGPAKTIVAPAAGQVSRAEWSPDGRRIAYAFGSSTKPADLYVVSATGGAPKQLTFSDQGSNLASALITPEKISWVNDGLTINAYLWKPKNLPAGARAPVIMFVHGGPTGQFADNYQVQPQYFASRGYVVIAPNVRGSSGYGKKFEDANNRDWGHGDLRDVVAGVEWAKKQSYVNPEKIGITGISYGGMLTMYAISFAPGVFQAAISGSGYGDVKDFHNIVPVLQHSKLLHYELGKWPSTPEVEAIYQRSSSILKAKNATAPAMIIHGYGLDELDSDYAAFKFARELAKHSKIVEYRAFPKETYYVYRHDNTKQMLQEMLAFFNRYLKDPSTGTSGPVTADSESDR